MKTLNRRTVLRGMGGTAIALPFLDAMMSPLPARAQESAITKQGLNGQPKRFVMIYTCVGQGIDWFKNTSKPDGTIDVLGPVMAPMERHKKDLILLDGISNVAAGRDNLSSGHDAMAHISACMPMRGAGGSGSNMAGGISIDQVIAKEIAGETKFQSGIQLSQTRPWTSNNILSYGAGGAPMPVTYDPKKALAQLFTDFKTDPLVFERAKAERKSILDSVARQYVRIVPRVSGGDRIKIQTHLDALREVEQRIGEQAVITRDTCAVPTLVANKTGSEQYITGGQIIMELTRMAFACDLTRVATLTWTSGVQALPWIGIPHMHDASHGPDGPRNTMSTWHNEYYAKFFDDLKAVQEGPGTLFDNTLFYWTTEVGCGNHDNFRTPVLVAGSAGGYFKTGQRRELKFSYQNPFTNATSTGDLFVSFLNAMGIPATTFGDPRYCKGAIAGLAA